MRPRDNEPDVAPTLVSPDYRYAAFISYRHIDADRKWALWLHNALESYRIPKRLVAVAGLAERVGRVFRDEEELAASADLSQAIEEALRDSRFLIVICSPAASVSEWVNAEVKQFRAMGRGERILAVLTEGDPRTSFPPALYEIREDVFESQQPLAADVRRSNGEAARTRRRMALLRLTATIVGCRFDDLRQREQERQIRRLFAAGFVFAALAVVLAAATVITYRARLDEQSQREIAEKERNQATERLAELDGGNALALLESEDFPGALLWLAAAADAAPQSGGRWRTLYGQTRARTPTLLTAAVQPAEVEVFDSSPISHRYATGGGDGFLRIGDATGKVIGVKVSARFLNDVRFSRDGNQIVTAASDGGVRVWDAATGQPVSAALDTGGTAHWGAISDDMKTIVTIAFSTGRQNYELRTWAPDGKPTGEVHNLGPSVRSHGFWQGPGGFLIAIGDDKGQARVYDLHRGLVATSALRHAARVNAVAIDNSGRYFATASDDHTARVWDSRSGRAVTPALQHDDSVTSLAFDPSGRRIVTGSWDHTARVWSVTDGRPLSASMQSNDGVLAVAFDATGTRVATGAFAGMARVWDAATGQPITPALQHDDDVDALSFDGTALLTKVSRVVRKWGLDNSDPRPLLIHHGKEVVDAEVSPDGTRLATASQDRTARVWDASTGVPVTPALRHSASVLNVTFSADGRRVLTTDDSGNVRAWDAATGSPAGPWLHHRLWAQYAQFQKAGNSVIIAGGDDAVHIWNYASGRELVTPIHQDGMIEGLAVSVDGIIAVTTLAKSLQLWSSETAAPVSRRVRLESVARRLVFSADGRRLATIDPDNTVRVWDRGLTPAGKTPIEPRATVFAASFSPDGRKLLTVLRDAAREWDVESGVSVGRAMRGSDPLREAVFTPDGRYVLTISNVGHTRIWDASTTEQVSCPQWLMGAPYQDAWDESGIQMFGVHGIGHLFETGLWRARLSVDGRALGSLRQEAEASAARRVAGGFLETLAPEEIARRVAGMKYLPFHK